MGQVVVVQHQVDQFLLTAVEMDPEEEIPVKRRHK